MAYEFKKLSDVEVVAEPTESANVLIEEDGVIKKAPKTAVGGAGGAGGYIWTLAEGDYTVDKDSLTITVTANYDEVLKVLDEGGSVYVNMPNSNGVYVKSNVVVWSYISAEMTGSTSILVFNIFNGNVKNSIPSMYVCMCGNGTYVPNS